MPAVAIIQRPIAFIKVVAAKTFVVEIASVARVIRRLMADFHLSLRGQFL